VTQAPKIDQDHRGGPNSGELKTVGGKPNQPITKERNRNENIVSQSLPSSLPPSLRLHASAAGETLASSSPPAPAPPRRKPGAEQAAAAAAGERSKMMNGQKKRGPRIEPFRHRVETDPKFFDKSWRKLHDAIREIYNHNASGLSFEELYR
jgi:hypothetical protein